MDAAHRTGPYARRPSRARLESMERMAVTMTIRDASELRSEAAQAAARAEGHISRMLMTPFASEAPSWRLSETLRPEAEKAILSRGARLDASQFVHHAREIKKLWHREDPAYWDYSNPRGGRERRQRRVPPSLRAMDAPRRTLREPAAVAVGAPDEGDGSGAGEASEASSAPAAAPSVVRNRIAFATAAELGVEKPLCLCLLYTSPSPRDATLSRMPSSA